MHIRFVVVGKPSREYYGIIQDYEKRLPKYCRFEAIELKDNAKPTDIIAKLKGYAICLDSKGKQLTSEELSTMLKAHQEMTFVIGGSEGLAEEVKKNCFLLSFSRMTFPHQMARLMLAEQVYRAFTIIKGEKYHK